MGHKLAQRLAIGVVERLAASPARQAEIARAARIGVEVDDQRVFDTGRGERLIGARASSPAPETDVTRTRRTSSVLIVEDDPNIALALEHLMRLHGYDPRRAADGDAALAAVSESTPNLILLDLMLPGRSGVEVCQSLRSDRSLDGIKIVMMTANGSPSARERALAAGADDLIHKPFAISTVIETVQALLSAP